ncbi:hypothetical protein ISS37_03395 [candidate division KSB1 bacterium]|nr:hypothetical protein [candidate division KSB1 bacterium]
MANVLEVKFKGSRRGFYLNPQGFPFRIGDYAIVQAEKGEDLGTVVYKGDAESCWRKLNGVTAELLRKPTTKDLEALRKNRDRERGAFQVCRDLISRHGMEMKLVDVEFQFDGKKVTFYFTAEGRVDFRELVKDLAAVYRSRIEMHQIGVRDEAKRVGGLGPCGCPLCCASFLTEFRPVTMQMVKDQNLPPNPGKNSGLCGRLFCCLLYEEGFYQEEMKKYPPLDAILETKHGSGRVEKLDIFKELVYVRYGEEEYEVLGREEANRLYRNNPEKTEVPIEPENENNKNKVTV